MSESNIFAKQDRQWAEQAERWGLTDLSEAAQVHVDSVACSIISEKRITDDGEKQKIYDDVKRQYLEHIDARVSSSRTLYESKDDAVEFKKGYQAFWRHKRELEEFNASQYNQGYEAAKQECLASTGQQSCPESTAATGDIDPLKEELQQLKEGFKALDERLKALEKYTQE